MLVYRAEFSPIASLGELVFRPIHKLNNTRRDKVSFSACQVRCRFDSDEVSQYLGTRNQVRIINRHGDVTLNRIVPAFFPPTHLPRYHQQHMNQSRHHILYSSAAPPDRRNAELPLPSPSVVHEFSYPHLLTLLFRGRGPLTTQEPSARDKLTAGLYEIPQVSAYAFQA